MAEEVRLKVSPIAWIAIYAAICAATSFIPIFPYAGGGGYVPLAVPMSALAPLLIGPVGGIVAAFVGGLVGMFLSPAAYPLGIIDVIITGTTPAIFTSLAANGNKRSFYALFLVIFVSQAIVINVFPYYVPGPAAGFANPPQPLYFLLSAWYWLPWIVIYASPLGFKVFPSWARSEERRKATVGLFFVILMGLMCWIIPWWYPYWYFYSYPVELAITVFIMYTWWVPTISFITSVIALPIVEGLRRSGLPRIQYAVW